jgi:hypothetical protein
MKTQTTASGGVGLGRGGRMSRPRKRDAVLRLLRGEDLEILSRALGVTAATLSGGTRECWRTRVAGSRDWMRMLGHVSALPAMGSVTENAWRSKSRTRPGSEARGHR